MGVPAGTARPGPDCKQGTALGRRSRRRIPTTSAAMPTGDPRAGACALREPAWSPAGVYPPIPGPPSPSVRPSEAAGTAVVRARSSRERFPGRELKPQAGGPPWAGSTAGRDRNSSGGRGELTRGLELRPPLEGMVGVCGGESRG